MGHPSQDALLTGALLKDVSNILGASAHEVSVPADTVIFRPGQPCESLVLLSQGCVKVHLSGESGREIILYRVEPGEVCALTLGCLINDVSYNATGIAETDLAGVSISRQHFDDLFSASKIFRDAVLRSQTTRILDLVRLLEDFAFRPIDERLARLLVFYGAGAGIGEVVGEIKKTHQDMAMDLGSAREVISRTLKRFEDDGLVRLERGSIVILNFNGLSALSGA